MTLGDYTVEEILGEGGMATVYRAHDAHNRTFALKKLRVNLQNDSELAARILREADIQNKLGHCPYIAKCYGHFEYQGHIVLVLDCVSGVSLDVHAAQNRYGYASVASWAQEILVALSAAHALGVIHRDIKPSNILITARGDAVLTDFGIAHVRGSRMTRNLDQLGTVPYMAPEQLGGVVRIETDLYSLGVTLYELCARRLPYGDLNAFSNDQQFFKAITAPDPYPSVKEFAATVPTRLAHVIDCCVRKKHQERYHSAEEALRDMQQCDGFDSAVLVPRPDGGFQPLAELFRFARKLHDVLVNQGTPRNARWPMASPPSAGLRRLTVMANGAFHSEYQLQATPFLIGRDEAACDLVFNTPIISRRHAELQRMADGTWRLFDLSSNGTFCNDKLIGKGNSIVLCPGARFRCCKSFNVEFVVD